MFQTNLPISSFDSTYSTTSYCTTSVLACKIEIKLRTSLLNNYSACTILLLSIFLCISFQTQAQSFGWAKRTANGYHKTSVSVDGSGNSYVTGTFTGTATFGSYTLTSAGSYDVYIAKYNSSGVVQWARRVGGVSSESSGDIHVDNSGTYVYLTGSFQSTTYFTTYHGFITFPLSTSGSDDVFVAKYDAWTGTLSWAQKGGGPNLDRSYGITADGSGNVYITGSFYGSASFSGHTVSSSGSSDADMFIAKYNSAGTIVAVKDPVGNGYDYGSAIAVDVSGNVYVTGGFSTSGIFFGTSGSIVHYLPGTSVAYVVDMFVVKYNSLLQPQWARQATGSSIDSGDDLLSDNSGNVYVIGTFYSSSLSFYNYGYPAPPLVATISNSGGSDMFLVKYDAWGNYQWVRQGGSSGYDEGAGIAKNSTGTNIYITGFFSGTADFTNSGTSQTLTTTGGASDKDVFIIKYGSSGNILYTLNGGGSATTEGESIGLDNSGNAYISGATSGTSTFGSTPAFYGSGGFIARVNPPLIILPPIYPFYSTVRINCGGPAVTTGGLSFSADNYYTATSTSGSTTSTADITNTTNDILYHTDRYSTTDLGSFAYNIPVFNGTYQVKLHFAEVYWGVDGRAGGKGTRVISVNIEGGAVELPNFDIIAEAGTRRAVIKTYTTTVSDGVLNIAFSASANRPKICAIEVTLPPSGKISAEEEFVQLSPNTLSLSVFPNPMREQGTISFHVEQTEHVQLAVYDLQGRKVANLYEGEALAGKQYTFTLDSSTLPVGMYITKLVSQSNSAHQKIIISR